MFFFFFLHANFHSSTYFEGTRHLMQELSYNFGKRTIHEVIYNLYDSPCTGPLDIWSSDYGTGLKKQLHIWSTQESPKGQCYRSLADQHEGQRLRFPRNVQSVSLQSSNDISASHKHQAPLKGSSLIPRSRSRTVPTAKPRITYRSHLSLLQLYSFTQTQKLKPKDLSTFFKYLIKCKHC